MWYYNIDTNSLYHPATITIITITLDHDSVQIGFLYAKPTVLVVDRIVQQLLFVLVQVQQRCNGTNELSGLRLYGDEKTILKKKQIIYSSTPQNRAQSLSVTLTSRHVRNFMMTCFRYWKFTSSMDGCMTAL